MRPILFLGLIVWLTGCNSLHSLDMSVVRSSPTTSPTASLTASLTISLTTSPDSLRHYLVFGFSDKAITGHAFVGFGADSAGVPQYHAFGLYPRSFTRALVQTGGTLFTLRNVPGAIKDDSHLLAHSPTQLVVYVPADAFLRAQRVLQSFMETRRYSLLDWDCVTFVQKVADAVGLKNFSRRHNLTPRAALDALIRLNTKLSAQQYESNAIETMGVY